MAFIRLSNAGIGDLAGSGRKSDSTVEPGDVAFSVIRERMATPKHFLEADFKICNPSLNLRRNL